MCPLPAGSRGYSSCLETGCSAAHTQTFVTISRTCFLRLLSRGSQTLYAGEKLQPTPPAATRHPGLRWLHRGAPGGGVGGLAVGRRCLQGEGGAHGSPGQAWKILLLSHSSLLVVFSPGFPGRMQALLLVRPGTLPEGVHGAQRSGQSRAQGWRNLPRD